MHKKGDIGYLVSGWNVGLFTPFDGGEQIVRLHPLNSWTFPDSSTLMVNHVKVHSCGKKQMKLFNLDDNELMKETNYSPDTVLFKTEEEAVSYAEKILKKAVDEFIQRMDLYLEKEVNKDTSNLHPIGLARYNKLLDIMRKRVEHIRKNGYNYFAQRYNNIIETNYLFYYGGEY